MSSPNANGGSPIACDESLRARLAEAVGADHVERAAEPLPPMGDATPLCWVAAPDNPEEVGELLRLAASEGLGVVPRGGGTRLALGSPLRKGGFLLSTHRLNRILQHVPADMTASVECGVPFSALQAQLGRHGQFLPLDPPHASITTIGGMVAANAFGARRLLYGTLRDQVIGMTVVHGDGRIGRSGGIVVKNVAGYDMAKLHIGALGTLGVVVQVNFKVRPLPLHRRVLILPFSRAEDAWQAQRSILEKQVLPAGLLLLNRPARGYLNEEVQEYDYAELMLVVALDNDESAICDQTETILGGLPPAASTKAKSIDDREAAALWEHLCEHPCLVDVLEGHWAACRMVVAVAELEPLCSEAGTLAAQSGLEVALVALGGTGVAYLYVGDREGKGESILPFVEALRGQVAAARGSLILESYPREIAGDVDVWGEPGPAFDLMRGIKAKLDPSGILNPGRFLGGL